MNTVRFILLLGAMELEFCNGSGPECWSSQHLNPLSEQDSSGQGSNLLTLQISQKDGPFPAVTCVSLGKLHLAAISSNKHYLLCFVFVVGLTIILRNRGSLSQNVSLWIAEVVTNHITSTRDSSLLLA